MANYKPVFHMPVMAPPASIAPETPEAYYSVQNVVVTATLLPARQAAQIVVSDAAQATVYTVCGGIVSFFPQGQTLPTPDAQTAPAGGALVIMAWPADFGAQRDRFPPGVETATTYIYQGIEQVQPYIAAQVETVSDAVCALFWQETQTAPVPADLQLPRDNFEAGVMTGQAWVFVDGGQPIGKAVATPLGDPVQGFGFQLQQLSGGVPRTYISPAATIRAVPQTDPTEPVGRWGGHPLLTAVDSLPLPAEFHLKVTTWNQVAKAYEPLANTMVSVIKTSAAAVTSTVVQAQTDLLGVVHLVHPDIAQFALVDRNLHFEIDLQTSQLFYDKESGALAPFPMASWSTRGWSSTNGAYLGHYDAFAGVSVGTAGSPAEFRVGYDVHLACTRLDGLSGAEMPFPPYSHVKIYAHSDKSDAVDCVTGPDGFVHGILYDVVNPMADMVYAEFQYASVRLEAGVVSRRAYFVFPADGQDSAIPSLAQDQAASLEIIGAPGDAANPVPWIVVNSAKSDAIYILQCIEEAVAYLASTVIGEPLWNQEPANELGPGLKLSFGTEEVSKTRWDAWPEKRIEIIFTRNSWDSNVVGPKPVQRQRTIFHELGHALNVLVSVNDQDQLNFSANPGPLGGHYSRSFSNKYFAFMEGFTEFFSALFVGPETIFALYPDTLHPEFANPEFRWSDPFAGFGYDPSAPKTAQPGALDYVIDASYAFQRGPFGPASDQKGYLVEGAFATALYLIANTHAAGRTDDEPVFIQRTDGDCAILAANPWLTSAVQQSLSDLIWVPLKSLDDAAEESTHAFVDAIRTHNPALWPKLKAIFNKLHIAVEEPDPLFLRLNGTQLTTLQAMIAYPNVEIAGFGFVDGMTLEFKNNQNSHVTGPVTVVSDFQAFLTIPPLYVGVYDLVVSTAWGTKTVSAFLTVTP